MLAAAIDKGLATGDLVDTGDLPCNALGDRRGTEFDAKLAAEAIDEHLWLGGSSVAEVHILVGYNTSCGLDALDLLVCLLLQELLKLLECSTKLLLGDVSQAEHFSEGATVIRLTAGNEETAGQYSIPTLAAKGVGVVNILVEPLGLLLTLAGMSALSAQASMIV